jgi:Na+-translocating ferredoxin:NAD+ oxidoreductase RnfC subunit
MREVCPSELEFTTSIEKAKESLRKTRQRHNENLENQRESRTVSRPPPNHR